jgi:hypothetical protein
VGTWANLTAQTAISITDGGIITPTGSYQPLESDGAVATATDVAMAPGTTEGDLVLLENTNATGAITIDGTGAGVECKADVVLDAGDIITLLWNGTNWMCVAVHDNS